MASRVARFQNPNLLNFAKTVESYSWLQHELLAGGVDYVQSGVRDRLAQLLETPMSFADVSSLAGDTIGKRDHHHARGAWLLLRLLGVRALGVHAPLWKKSGESYVSPVLNFISMGMPGFGLPSATEMWQEGELRWQQSSGYVSAVAVEGRKILVCQVVSDPRLKCTKAALSAALGMFGFCDRRLARAEESLGAVASVLKKATGYDSVRYGVLHLHQHRNDRFALYELSGWDGHEFTHRRLQNTARDFSSELAENPDYLTELPQKVEGWHFKELPPCRGSRALQILSILAREQWRCDDLKLWPESHVLTEYRKVYGSAITRDAGRHDLEDRLLVQGLASRYNGEYYVTVKGMAMYVGCLAKYSTMMAGTPDTITKQLIEWCEEHHARVAVGSSVYLQ